MVATTFKRDANVATEQDRERLASISRLLARASAHAPQLVVDGEAVELPTPIVELLTQSVQAIERGETLTVVPHDRLLTSQEAADVLSVSRPYLVRLLERGEIPFTMTGTHRRILASDLLAYKARRDAKRREGLRQLTQLSEELGLYADV
ncbi:MAG: helix-turn-helix domain-containing protein [Chloroflexota bacterium]